MESMATLLHDQLLHFESALMESPVKIETLPVAPGVCVVPVKLDDAAALATLVAENRHHLRTFMPKVVGLDSLPVCQAYLHKVLACAVEGTLLEWHIVANDHLCGAIRLNHIEHDNRKISIGYYLGEQYQGRGLATSSVRAVMKFAFERLDFNRIELKCASDNVASQRVAERLGFAWEGLLRQAELVDGVYLDHYVYGLLRDEFAAQIVVGMKHAA
jgi:ribosomal-protein-serine acetyltransferase